MFSISVLVKPLIHSNKVSTIWSYDAHMLSTGKFEPNMHLSAPNLSIKLLIMPSLLDLFQVEFGTPIPEILKKYKNILEAHRVTGSQADYIIKVVAESIQEYDEFQQVLIKNIEFNSMSSGISLQELKSTTILPIK